MTSPALTVLIPKAFNSTLQEGDDSTEKDQARVDRTGDPGYRESPVHSNPSSFVSVGGLPIPLYGVLHGR